MSGKSKAASAQAESVGEASQPRVSVRDRLGPYSRSAGPPKPRADVVPRRGRDDRQARLEDKLEKNKADAEALRAQREVLNVELSGLKETEEEGTSTRRRRREHTPRSQTRTYRSDHSRGVVVRQQKHSGGGGRSHGRSTSSSSGDRERSGRRFRRGSLDRDPQTVAKALPDRGSTEDLTRRLAELEQRLVIAKPDMGGSAVSSSPFSPEIDKERTDPSKKTPRMESYDGSGDPYEHSQAYDRLMNYYGYSDAAKCQIFITTLTKDARQWMSTLAPNSVSSWKEFTDKFHARFGSNKRRGKPTG